MSGRCTHRSGDNFVTIGGSRPGHCPGKFLSIVLISLQGNLAVTLVAPLRMLPAFH